MSWGAGRPTTPGPRAHQRARYVLRCARPLKPATVLFEGDDPRAYIIASNIARRYLALAGRSTGPAEMAWRPHSPEYSAVIKLFPRLQGGWPLQSLECQAAAPSGW
jgi:hypothetical protein